MLFHTSSRVAPSTTLVVAMTPGLASEFISGPPSAFWANVARFLAAVGEATEVPPRSPGRGPPYWKCRVLRRQALGEEDAGQGRWEQETA